MSDSTTQFYTQLSQSYDELFPADPQTIDLLEEAARRDASVSRTPRVLDAGCGTGTHLRELLRRGLDGWGLDLSTDMIDIAARRDPDHVHRYRAADMGTVADHPATPLDLVYSLGNTISHLPSHDAVHRWIQTASSALTSTGGLVLQFMDVSLLPVGGSMDLPQLTATSHEGSVSMERRYSRETARTLRFDAVLRGPEEQGVHPISNTLLVLSTDEVRRMLNSAGFTEISVNSSSWSRMVCATLTDKGTS